MSTVKISQLTQGSTTTNKANTIFVGVNLETSATGSYTLGQIFETSDAYAQAAFLKANTPSSVANSAGVFANSAFLAANSGALFANASFITANASYVAQNTTASFANGAFVTANASYTSQNTTASFANAAFIRANSGYAQANSAASFANGAFTKANNALANASGTLDGSLITTGSIEPKNGFVYTPTVLAGVQTAITINMTTQSLVRAQTATGLVVTLSNLLTGKEVVAWITNTAATSQVFTHGVSALNSTINTTTYTIPATTTILARYMSIDGTTQNTFVAITKA